MSYENDLEQSTQRDQKSANCQCIPEHPPAIVDELFWKPHFKKEERSRCENRCKNLMDFGCGKFTTGSGQQVHCCQRPDKAVKKANDCAAMPKKQTRSGFDNQKQCTNQCNALTHLGTKFFECKGKVRNDVRLFVSPCGFMDTKWYNCVGFDSFSL